MTRKGGVGYSSSVSTEEQRMRRRAAEEVYYGADAELLAFARRT
jgi:hypothetical protein